MDVVITFATQVLRTSLRIAILVYHTQLEEPVIQMNYLFLICENIRTSSCLFESLVGLNEFNIQILLLKNSPTLAHNTGKIRKLSETLSNINIVELFMVKLLIHCIKVQNVALICDNLQKNDK